MEQIFPYWSTEGDDDHVRSMYFQMIEINDVSTNIRSEIYRETNKINRLREPTLFGEM